MPPLQHDALAVLVDEEAPADLLEEGESIGRIYDICPAIAAFVNEPTLTDWSAHRPPRVWNSLVCFWIFDEVAPRDEAATRFRKRGRRPRHRLVALLGAPPVVVSSCSRTPIRRRRKVAIVQKRGPLARSLERRQRWGVSSSTARHRRLRLRSGPTFINDRPGSQQVIRSPSSSPGRRLVRRWNRGATTPGAGLVRATRFTNHPRESTCSKFKFVNIPTSRPFLRIQKQLFERQNRSLEKRCSSTRYRVDRIQIMSIGNNKGRVSAAIQY